MRKQYTYIQFDGTLDSSRTAIEGAIGVQLSERDSSYWGGTYFQFRDSGSGLRLQLHHNMDHTGDWIIPEFKGSQILCCIDGPVEIASTFVAKMVVAGGTLLVTRTKEIKEE